MEGRWRCLVVVVLIEVVVSVEGSLYDPHVYPTVGPFFEGWYLRAVDHDAGRSFAVLFGKVLPIDPAVAQVPAFLGVLYTDATMTRLFAYDDLPSPSVISVTVRDGKPVTADPGVDGPAWFKWSAGSAGYIEVLPEESFINVTVEGVHLEAHVGQPEPWSVGGEGPQGWLYRLPLPLNWFVYSTRSPLLSYRLSFIHSRQEISGRAGLIHMEKNRGRSFPRGWIWIQGMRQDHVTFAAAFGPVDFGPLTLPGHLGGYRNPQLGLNIDFRPDNSYMTYTHDACKGDLLLTLYTLSHKLIFHLFAQPRSFSDCIYGPTKNGFSDISQQSFKATAEILVFERNYFNFHEIDSQVLTMSALEFGGIFTCDGKCTPETEG